MDSSSCRTRASTRRRHARRTARGTALSERQDSITACAAPSASMPRASGPQHRSKSSTSWVAGIRKKGGVE
eukprot:14562040-Alexandrium_andersonii.AAC.1